MRIVFQDDFSDANSGWDRYEDEYVRQDYLNGQYQILVNRPNYAYWSNPGANLSDVRIQTVVTKAGGPDDSDFGVICRYKDTDNFYAFFVSSRGYANISKAKNGDWVNLGDWQTSTAIRPGKDTNEVAVECIGPNLRLFVNERLAAEATDSDFARGDVGLIVGTYEEGGVDIRFDDVRVFKVQDLSAVTARPSATPTRRPTNTPAPTSTRRPTATRAPVRNVTVLVNNYTSSIMSCSLAGPVDRFFSVEPNRTARVYLAAGSYSYSCSGAGYETSTGSKYFSSGEWTWDWRDTP